MSQRRRLIRMTASEVPRTVPPALADAAQAQQLHMLAQLVEQIDDALLVVEHPQLAAQVFAALKSSKAA